MLPILLYPQTELKSKISVMSRQDISTVELSVKVLLRESRHFVFGALEEKELNRENLRRGRKLGAIREVQTTRGKIFRCKCLATQISTVDYVMTKATSPPPFKAPFKARCRCFGIAFHGVASCDVSTLIS